MNWTEKAFVVSVAKFSEHALRVTVLAETHGLYTGILKYGHRQRGIFDVGNHLLLTWTARLSEHIGTFRGELITPFAAYVMQDEKRLHGLALAATLTQHFIPERIPEQPVYLALQALLLALAHEQDWQRTQAKFELELLNATGYGLDLFECAATGASNNLLYVSPKSGRAVSAVAGEPYKDKLFRLPAFLVDDTATSSSEEIADALALTAFFLDRAAIELHKPLLHLATKRRMKHLQFA